MKVFMNFPHISKTRYLQGFCVVVLILAIVRCNSDRKQSQAQESAVTDTLTTEMPVTETAVADSMTQVGEQPKLVAQEGTSIWSDPTVGHHRIYSVPSYAEEFPDTNALQMTAAHKWGIRPVQNREEAERRKSELVYVGSNPYFEVERLYRSIPYLVPRAAVLLQDIGRSFADSLYMKGVPLHKIIVTSVTRTKEDVQRLRRYNHNATENSCHMYGTTFDISYNRYRTVETREEPRRAVRNDSLKFILSEVLRDQRNLGKCYIKYERKQGCFHITVR